MVRHYVNLGIAAAFHDVELGGAVAVRHVAVRVQSVSPAPVGRHQFAEAHVLYKPGFPTGAGMVGFGKEFRKGQPG